MNTYRLFLFTAIVVTGIVTACSTQPAAESTVHAKSAGPAKQEPALYTAKECLRRVQGQANMWSADARPVHIESDLTSESDGTTGKSAVWRFMYVSGTRNAMRTFICSGSRDADAPPFGLSEGMNLPLPQDGMAFDSFLLKADSDQALEIAQGRGGEAILKKNPKQPVTYIVEMTRGVTTPYWYVIYGKNLKDNKGVGIVNATTVTFVRASK